MCGICGLVAEGKYEFSGDLLREMNPFSAVINSLKYEGLHNFQVRGKPSIIEFLPHSTYSLIQGLFTSLCKTVEKCLRVSRIMLIEAFLNES